MKSTVSMKTITAAAVLVCAAASLSPAFAQKSPAAAAANKLNAKVRLTDGVKTITRTRKELGFTLKSAKPVAFGVDKGALKDVLARLAKNFNTPAEDAKPYVYKGQVKIDPGAYARVVNIPTTAETIVALVAKSPGTVSFRMAVNKKPPTLTAERLQGINGILGSMTTQTSAVEKRNHNIALSIKRINGTLLSPGEVFSLNTTVGKRTQQNGFLTAKVFEDAKIVDGIGGGVSQVTGTLFGAAAEAGLAIVEVHPHSRPVAYLPVGYDATVAFGSKDLRFKNNTPRPVYIRYTFQNQKLTATLFGAKTPGRKVTLKPAVQQLGPGKVNAQLYRIVKEKGKLVAKEKLFGHAYRWDPKSKG